MSTPENVLRLEDLCKTVGVFSSGYYNWKNLEDKRKQKELRKQKEF